MAIHMAVLLTKGSADDGQEQSAAAVAGSVNNAALHSTSAGPPERTSGISPWTQWVLLCSLGLTAIAVLGHVLRGRPQAKPGRAGAAAPPREVPEPGAAAAAAKRFARGPGDAHCVEPELAHGCKSTLDGLRRRSGHAVDGTEGSKPASLPLQKLIEAGDTKAVQDFVAHNSPELVEELFNMGDPALNGTTPLLLALRLGKDDISRLLLVRSMPHF